MITWDDFVKVDIRSGRVVDAKDFPEAKTPAIKLWVDFGDLGVKQTSAQITHHYSPESVIGSCVIGVVNLPPKRIAGFKSEFLVLGFEDQQEGIHLVTFDERVPLGNKLK